MHDTRRRPGKCGNGVTPCCHVSCCMYYGRVLELGPRFGRLGCGFGFALGGDDYRFLFYVMLRNSHALSVADVVSNHFRRRRCCVKIEWTDILIHICPSMTGLWLVFDELIYQKIRRTSPFMVRHNLQVPYATLRYVGSCHCHPEVRY